MARQLAALTKNSSYRHSPIQVKDATYFGMNHTLQTTPLPLGSQLSTTDFSVFKTPPEGHTPVDQKQFDFNEEETLRVVQNLSLSSFYEKQLNDSGITHEECLDSVEVADVESTGSSKYNEAIKSNDDDASEFHTPPEFQDESNEGPPFGYPPKQDELINSVIELLSKTTTENTSHDDNAENCLKEDVLPNENELVKQDAEEFFDQNNATVESCLEKNDLKKRLENGVDLEEDCCEKDSLDGSPRSRKSFTQEEDDSGISLVDENDVMQESTVTNAGHFEKKNEEIFLGEKKIQEKYNKRTREQHNNINTEKKTHHSETCTKSNSCEGEDMSSIGWQTRHRRMSKKRQDRDAERMSYYNGDNTEGRNLKDPPTESGPRDTTSRRSTKNRNSRMDKSESYRSSERPTEYSENAWSGRRRDEVETVPQSPKRRRGGQTGKKSDGRRSSNREKNVDRESAKRDNVQDAKAQLQPSMFSYRDALLKDGSNGPSAKPSDLAQTSVFSMKAERMFDLESAVNYLSSVWTSVNNLRRKDPSKVYIYNDD